MITAADITYRIGKKTLLYPMSFSVMPGRLTVLLGPNGAGKSTLLRLLSGEEKPTSGAVLIGQVAANQFTAGELALKRAVLTQHHSISLPFTCEEIVMMGRYPHQRAGSRKNKQIVRHCLEEMDALSLTKRLFHTLSGGEQQRVQLARVLAQLHESEREEENSFQDKILLLDEPTASMDYRHQQLCLDTAKSLSERGCTVLAVLHDLNLAARYADYVLLMKQGRLLGKGRTGEVLQAQRLSEAYDIIVDVIRPEPYGFPVLIPAGNQQTFLTTSKK